MPTPNPTSRREYKGAAAASTLASSMSNSDGSFTLTAASNWPTGSVGQFIVTVSRGQSDEEKILCSAQASKVVTVATRGFDGTAAQAHASGSTVECTISAFDADEWNQHTNATGAVHGVAGNVVGDTDAQTLTNKTINTASGNVLKVNGNTLAASAGSATLSVPNSTDTLVGRNTTDSLANKTLVAPVATSGITTDVVLTAQGIPSQSGDLQNWITGAGALTVRVTQGGNLYSRANAAQGIDGLADAQFNAGSATDKPLVVRGFAGQTADLQQWQTATPATVARVDSAGNIFATNLTNAWTAYTPTFTNVTSGSGTFAFLLMGKTLFVRGIFLGGTATAAGQISATLPSSLTSAVAGTSVVFGNSGATLVPWSTTHATTMSTIGTPFTLGQSLVALNFNGVIEVA